MGFRICYIAAQMSIDDVVEGLSLELGEETDEQPFDDDWIAHQQETGFTILWSGDEGYAFRQSKRLAELSNRACVYSAWGRRFPNLNKKWNVREQRLPPIQAMTWITSLMCQ